MKKDIEKNFPYFLITSLTSLAIIYFAFSSFPLWLKREVREKQGGVCAMCGRKVGKLQIHHIIPQSMGGKDVESNAIGLCDKCHKIADEMALKYHIFLRK